MVRPTKKLLFTLDHPKDCVPSRRLKIYHLISMISWSIISKGDDIYIMILFKGHVHSSSQVTHAYPSVNYRPWLVQEMAPVWHQVIIWTNVDLLSNRQVGTYSNELLFEMQKFSFTKMHLKMFPANGCHIVNISMFRHTLPLTFSNSFSIDEINLFWF